MKILFDGASSFSGYWMVRALVEAGHEVFCPFTKDSAKDYTGLRAERVAWIAERVVCGWGCRLGNSAYTGFVEATAPELYGHHAFPTGNYKATDYSPLATLAQVTEPMVQLMPLLKELGCKGLVVTGSYFERGVGEGSDGLPSFSPYAACKTMAAEWQAQSAFGEGIRFGRFYMPNPFGPGEDRGFTAYAADKWRHSEPVEVRTPDYIRDNIPVDLLGLAYQDFCQKLLRESSEVHELRCEPSGYQGSQRAFAEKLQGEIRTRTDWPCELEFCKQTEFTEPRERQNRDSAIDLVSVWDEKAFWNEYVNFLVNGL